MIDGLLCLYIEPNATEVVYYFIGRSCFPANSTRQYVKFQTRYIISWLYHELAIKLKSFFADGEGGRVIGHCSPL